MPNYLIHIGPHKTGTTYLQFRLDAARQQLGQAGVAYPTVWNASQTLPSHRGLMIGLREAHVDRLRSQFEAIERDDPDYVLISAEGLSLLDAPAITLLKTLVGSNPVTIVFYCRRWSELLPSLWQEKVKHGHHATFPEFLKDETTDPFASQAMNFAKRLDIYSSIFGRKSIKLVSYSNLGDDEVDLASHFFECFLPQHRRLFDDCPRPLATRPNQSLPPRETEVIRALNAIHVRNGMPTDTKLREWYMANKGRFNLADLFSAILENIATPRFSDTLPDVHRLHTMLFSAYGDLLVPPVLLGRLFSPRVADSVFCEQSYLADTGALLVLEDLYATFRRETDAVS